ncbi:MAG: hypothetical protein ACO1OB_25640 [Archangium sp.]
MNALTVLAAILSAADGGAECTELPMGESMVARMCKPYLLVYSDMAESSASASQLNDFFIGLLKGAGANDVAPEPGEVTIDGKKVAALRSLVDSPKGKWDATAVSVFAPGSTKPRLMACIAFVGAGGKREACPSKLEAMRQEPMRAPATSFVINGKPLPVPRGCRFQDPELSCEDGSVSVHVGTPPATSKDELVAEMARMTTATAAQLGLPTPAKQVACTQAGTPAVCHVASVTNTAGETSFVATMRFSRTEGASVAVCGSDQDPRVKMPKACAVLMKFEAAK